MYEFWYHNETLLMVRLVCTSLSVSFCLCYVLVFFLGSLLSMIQNNDVPFLASFFIFFANFLVVYRASIIETTTTQKDLSTAASISNYFMWYLQCFRYITEKKN